MKLHKVFTATDAFLIPSGEGIKRIMIKAWGAGGGGGGAGRTSAPFNSGGDGGAGGFASTIIPVIDGDQIDVVIGDPGLKGLVTSGTGFAGTGGGDTYVTINLADPPALYVGSGGGGGGGDPLSAIGGNGGNGGTSSANGGLNGVSSTAGGAGNVNAANVRSGGTAVTMAGACPPGATPTFLVNNTSVGTSTASGGICYVSSSAVRSVATFGKGAARHSVNSQSRPSGGGGGAGYPFGGGGQGALSPLGSPGSGAGGGGGATLINKNDFSNQTNIIDLKSSAGTITPPIDEDGDYIPNVGVGGSGANGAVNAGAGLVVIYFLYN